MSKLLAETLVELTSKIIALENRLSVSECDERHAEDRLKKAEEENKKLRERIDLYYDQNKKQAEQLRKKEDQVAELESLNETHRKTLAWVREQFRRELILRGKFLRRYTGLTLEFKKFESIHTRPKK